MKSSFTKVCDFRNKIDVTNTVKSVFCNFWFYCEESLVRKLGFIETSGVLVEIIHFYGAVGVF